MSIQGRPSSKYNSSLDGIRGLGAMLVIHGHVSNISFRGALALMEVFFVMSAFFIGTMLYKEIRESGRVDLIAFWRRRMLRLYPLLLVVLTCYAVVAYFVVDDMWPVIKDYLATVFYISNFFKMSDYPYPSIYSHSWSLAIEEQFYIVCPLVFLFFARFKFGSLAVLQSLVLLIIFFVAWRSYLYASGVQFERLYYGTDTRVDAFVVGVLAAVMCFSFRDQIKRSIMFAVLGFVSVPAMFLLVFFARPQQVEYFLGYQSLLLVACALSIMYVTLRPENIYKGFLSNKVFVWLGVRCYGLYLWHWPLVWLIKRSGVEVNEFVAAVFVVLFTILLAALSFKYIEEPLLYSGKKRRVGQNVNAVA